MTSFNVAWQVVDLIDADTEQEALDSLRSRLQAAGFEVVDDTGNAFESEDQNGAS